MDTMKENEIQVLDPQTDEALNLDLEKYGDAPEFCRGKIMKSMLFDDEKNGDSQPVTTIEAPVRKRSTSQNTNESDFSISGFSRLMAILRDDDEAKEALYNMGQEMSRAQLDVGMSRDDFWGII